MIVAVSDGLRDDAYGLIRLRFIAAMLITLDATMF